MSLSNVLDCDVSLVRREQIRVHIGHKWKRRRGMSCHVRKFSSGSSLPLRKRTRVLSPGIHIEIGERRRKLRSARIVRDVGRSRGVGGRRHVSCFITKEFLWLGKQTLNFLVV